MAHARVVARWEDDATTALLTRGTDVAEYQFVLTSKTLDARARAAIKEALRLDRQEAPQRELERQQKQIAEDGVARQKARSTTQRIPVIALAEMEKLRDRTSERQ